MTARREANECVLIRARRTKVVQTNIYAITQGIKTADFGFSSENKMHSAIEIINIRQAKWCLHHQKNEIERSTFLAKVTTQRQQRHVKCAEGALS